MDVKKIVFMIIIAICIISVSYGIYFQIYETGNNEVNVVIDETENSASEFDNLFDNQINYQEYETNSINKTDKEEELVYTVYTLNQSEEGKYEINVNIPTININNSNVEEINQEIISIFKDKTTNIMSSESDEKQIYTVEYTAYVNENILSLVIKSTLKEGSNAQRIIIKAYTLNLFTNEELTLADIIEIEGKDTENVESIIKSTIQSSIDYTNNLKELGYEVYERDIESSIYKVENSNNYFLGPNGTIYIIYAYGNASYTSERDIVVIE